MQDPSSTAGVFRLKNDILSKEKIEEAAVNDRGRRGQPVGGLEGIVQQTLLANPSTDIVLMYFVDPPKIGKNPFYQESTSIM
jgi:hypothetical protein